MRRLLVVIGAAGALAFPAAVRADDPPTSTDQQNAAQECRFERGATAATREAFAQHYGTNANKRNAFGKCVSAKARDEAKERDDAEQGAQTSCRAERGTTPESRAAFEQKYGTNGNGKNAFGKCVSAQAAAAKQAADDADRDHAADRKSAAKQCATERGTTTESRAAFAKKYGTNRNGKNAFGKCVSKVAKAMGDGDKQS
jgi:hypothetical protein